jgi:hypothetical protein
MNELAEAIEEVRTELADAQSEILFDECDIYAPMFVDGGPSGDSVTLNPIPVAQNVGVTQKGLGKGREVSVGGETYIATHKLTMPRTSSTVAITPRHQIRVYARGLTPQLIFEKPVINEDSIDPLLEVSAVLVMQGYQ